MKRALATVLMMFATALPAHSATVPLCDSVTRDTSVTKGSKLQCLTSSENIVFESLRGPMIVNFWGSWCAPCLAEVPYLRAFHKKYPTLPIVGVDVEEKNKMVGRTFAARHKMTWPHYYDAAGTTRAITGIGVPITLFLDKNGKIVHKKIGVLRNVKELENLSKKYLRT